MTKNIIPPDYFQLNEDAKSVNRKEILAGIIDFMVPYKKPLILSTILMIIGAIAQVSGPYFVKLALDDGIAKNNLAILKLSVILYFVAALIQWATTFARIRIMANAGQSIIFNMRARLFQHIQELSMSFFSHYSVGRLISRVINDVSVLRQFVTWAINATLRNFITLIGIVIAMFALDTKLSIITFITLPLLVWVTIIFRKNIQPIYRRVRAGISWVNTILAENINGVRVVQAFSRQKHNYENFSNRVNKYHLNNNLKSAKMLSLFFPSIDVIGGSAIALVILIGGTNIFGNPVSAGILAAFILYVERFFNPIQDLSRRYDQFQSAMIGGERILELLKIKVDIADAENAFKMPSIKGDVEFNQVNFFYKDDPETNVLTDINLKAKAGQTIALVGETGAGKSTLIKLVSRFYDPTSGTITIDGNDIKLVEQKSLRSQMGIVLQESFLFGGNIYDNIFFGNISTSENEVYAAAKAVGAHKFIMQLKKGYQTSVEEGGALLSGGQKQLISFARALLANPRILILDEATSSIDTQTEIIIQKALDQLLKDRTAIVIAHRLSTIVNADKILVMHNGKIEESGTHRELLSLGKRYYNLYSMGFQESLEE